MPDKKAIALQEFQERLLRSPIARSVAKVYLHGSFLRGQAEEESDVDLLVFAFGSPREVQDVASDLAFDLLLERGERVEALVYCHDDYRYPPSPFVYQVLSGGKEIYSSPHAEPALLSGAEVRLPCPRTASFAGKAPALAAKQRKRAALPTDPTERGGPPPLSDSPHGLCGVF